MTDLNTELEEADMASQHHSMTQFRMAAQLAKLDQEYNGATELSLDISDPNRQEILQKYGLSQTRELKPDIALYSVKNFQFPKGIDRVQVTEIPLLAIEIVSPTQNSLEIINKLKAYFELGVKSCWYVDPLSETVRVYNKAMESEAYHNGEVVDKTLGIKIDLNRIFY
jgi:Uma2 family endonuclease